MNSENISFSKINEQNSRFWCTQSELTLKQLSDEELFESAKADMNSEMDRGRPLRLQTTLEVTLAINADRRRAFRASFARKGGKSRKGDALQDLIEEIVKRRPTITPGQALHELAGSAGAGIVTSIDNKSDVLADEDRRIHFVTNDGRAKTAKVSALRFRLARAKREIGAITR